MTSNIQETMKSTHKFALAAVVAASALFAACSDVTYPDTPTGPAVENLEYSVNKKAVTLTWAAAPGAIGYQVVCDAEIVATPAAGETSLTLKNQTTGKELAYTVKAVYEGNIVSPGITVRFIIDPIPTKAALLLPCNSVADLTDDDEIAAAEWFAETYATNGEILTPADIASLDPEEYAVVWINIDRVGLAPGWENLPSELVNPEAINSLTNYAAKGGNLFLTKFATQLTVPYGIIDARYAPGIFGSGPGGEGSDNWCMNAQIGLIYDHRGHDIFKGLTTLPDYGHETFALEGPGWREDHNCCWDLNAYGFSGDPNTVVNFQDATNSTVLATWAHVVDFAVAGIVEFNSTTTRAGRCLAIGLSAYEFAQNTGNPYQENTNRLTKNCIDYLNK